MELGEIGDSALQPYRWLLAGIVAYGAIHFEINSISGYGEFVGITLALALLFFADIWVKMIISMAENRTLNVSDIPFN